MATLQDKIHEVHVEHLSKDHAVGQVTEETLNSGGLVETLRGRKTNWLSPSMLQLYLIMSVGYLVSTLNGYDGSLMGAINAMPSYRQTMGLTGVGSGTGVIFIVYNLGQIAAIPLCAYIADKFGRRMCIFVGCIIVLVGTAVQTSARTQGQFIGGRFVLGLGAALASASAPAYTVELAHPSVRGLMAGMYNTFWWIGNIVASWTTYGTNLHLASSWAWRLPTLLQCVLPSVVMASIMYFPESPRWLISQDRIEEARAIFTKYHAEGDESAPIVLLQVSEIQEELARTRDDKPWWNYTDLIRTRSKRYRLALVISLAFFGQWSGNAVVTYFLPEMMTLAGILDPNKQLLINAILSICGMSASIYGATLLDRLGRRKMLLISLSGCLGSYILLTAFTASAISSPNLAYGTIVSVFVFIVFFAWAFTPLQTLYSVECLENRTRMKGSAQNFLWLNVATTINTYAVSVGIEKIGWKIYLVFVAWICVEMVVIFFYFVETAGKTLEELSVVFEAKNPVKESLRKSRTHSDGQEILFTEKSDA